MQENDKRKKIMLRPRSKNLAGHGSTDEWTHAHTSKAYGRLYIKASDSRPSLDTPRRVIKSIFENPIF